MADYQKQWEFLKKSAQANRIPHAVMLCGIKEDEVKVLAIEFAKFINCSSKNNLKRPCYNCDNCKKIEQGVHPDFLLVEPKPSGEIEISQIRDLIWRISLKTFNATFKIAVINKAHLMNQQSQNCLLKILEEPKGNTVLILTTYYPGLLLPTIISRVQKLRFLSEKEPAESDSQQTLSVLLKLLKSDISFRFRYVKELSEEDVKRTTDVLTIWIFYLRSVLLKKLEGQKFGERNNFNSYSPRRMAKIISSFQDAYKLLSTTNINPKLTLETLFMEL